MELYTIIYAFMGLQLGLHGSVKEVFAVIFGFWKMKKEPVTIANSIIKAITGLSHGTIVAAKNYLVDRHLISVTEIRGRASLYEVILPEDLSDLWTRLEYDEGVSNNQTGPEINPKLKKENMNKNKRKNGSKATIVSNRSEFNRPDKL